PPWLVAIVEKCLAYAPGARYANAGALADALDLGPSTPRRTPARALLAVAGVALALALVAFAVKHEPVAPPVAPPPPAKPTGPTPEALLARAKASFARRDFEAARDDRD